MITNPHTVTSNYVIPHLKSLYLKTNDWCKMIYSSKPPSVPIIWFIFLFFYLFLMERFFSILQQSECQIQIPLTAGWAWSSLQLDTDVPTAAALCCWYRSSWSLCGFRAQAPLIKVVKLAFLSAPEVQISPGSCFFFRHPSRKKWSRGLGGYAEVIVGWRWREVEVVSSVGGRLKSDHTMERIYHFPSLSSHIRQALSDETARTKQFPYIICFFFYRHFIIKHRND